jgi:hypothetical protein
MFGAIPAIALNTMTWNGVQGVDSVRRSCNLGERPYLHWILNGVDKGANPLTLILGGTGNGQYLGVRANPTNGAYHFNTGFFTLNGLTANVPDVPGGNNLVISDGCAGGQTTVPEFPTIALPIAAVIGLVFFFQHRKRKEK